MTKRSEWWKALTPEKRAQVKRQQETSGLGKRAGLHHYQDDMACQTCGTDSTVGCIAEVT